MRPTATPVSLPDRRILASKKLTILPIRHSKLREILGLGQPRLHERVLPNADPYALSSTSR
jgi:hypothetical protein